MVAASVFHSFIHSFRLFHLSSPPFPSPPSSPFFLAFWLVFEGSGGTKQHPEP